jgi:hypothetical protein
MQGKCKSTKIKHLQQIYFQTKPLTKFSAEITQVPEIPRLTIDKKADKFQKSRQNGRTDTRIAKTTLEYATIFRRGRQSYQPAAESENKPHLRGRKPHRRPARKPPLPHT